MDPLPSKETALVHEPSQFFKPGIPSEAPPLEFLSQVAREFTNLHNINLLQDVKFNQEVVLAYLNFFSRDSPTTKKLSFPFSPPLN